MQAIGMHCQQVVPRRPHASTAFTSQPPRRCQRTVVRSGDDIRGSKMEKNLFGENFGARDPFAGEIETNFGEKVLGNFNTEHIIKPPDTIRKFLGLSARFCKDNVGNLAVLSDDERELLRNQVPGWRVATDAGKHCIRQDWKLKDAAAAEQLAGMVQSLAQNEGHAEGLVLTHNGDSLTAQVSTVSLGGLTENDFIVASKVNDLDIKDLLPKRKARFWA